METGIPILNGVLIMAETMNIINKNNYQYKTKNYSAFMASLPIGITHSAMYVSQLGWAEKKTYHYLRWSSTFNKYSLNWIFLLNDNKCIDIPTKNLEKIINIFDNIRNLEVYESYTYFDMRIANRIYLSNKKCSI